MTTSPTSDDPGKGGREPAGVLPPDEPVGLVEGDVFPLTPQQKALWLAEQERPGGSSYNGAFLFEITGPVRPLVMEAAFAALVSRHEILRACVRTLDGAARLFIAPAVRVRCPVSDLRLLTEDGAAARVDELTKVEARTPFDLTAPPLMRAALIRIDDTRSILMLTLHHLVCDGWSLSTLALELTRDYEVLAAGGTPDTSAPALQFGDYATWLDTALTEPALAAQTAFWQRRLKAYRRFDVPGDVGPATGDTTSSDIMACALPAGLIERFEARATAGGGTLFTAALAALAVVLGAAADRTDVTLGVPVVGRDQPELEPVIGPLINYLLLATDLAAPITFLELEQKVRRDAFEAFENQSVPLETVVAALAADGLDVPSPIYSVCFVSQLGYGNANPLRPFADCHLRSLPSVSSGAIYDLFVFLVKRETGYRLSVDYRTSRYSKARVTALLDGFVAVMEAVAQDPQVQISGLVPRPTPTEPAAASVALPVLGAATFADTGTASFGTADLDNQDAYVLPASTVQQRFWLLGSADPSATSLHVPAFVRIKGDLDVSTLQICLDQLTDRHEALGTSFRQIDGRLHQIVRAERRMPLEQTALPQPATIADRDAELRQLLQAEMAKPFNLATGPLARARLFSVNAHDHVLALTFHHGISDGQSVAILQRELWLLYTANRQGQALALPMLEVQYGDYAANEQALLADTGLQGQIDFWTRTLAAPLPVLDFPLDTQPTSRAVQRTALEAITIAPEIVGKLKQATRAASTTMFVVTATAFAALLARYGRSTDILFGCPVANRTTETSGVFGPFAGPMAIRVDLSGDPTLNSAVARMSSFSLDALDATDVPFDEITKAVDARSVGGRNPLFQFYFVYQQAFLQGQTTAGLEISPVPSFAIGTPFELQLVMVERGDTVTAQVDYNPDLLSQATVRALLEYFSSILARLADEGGQVRLSELAEPFLGTARRLGTHRVAVPFAAAQSETEQTLVDVWGKLLQRSGIGIHDDFFDLGGQSILAARLVMEVERVFGCRIQISTVAQARTIAQLARAIRDPSVGRQLIMPMQTSGDGTPLFLVHCGGGHVLRYEDVVRLLDKVQPVYGISAPLLGPDDTLTTVESLATRYITEMQVISPRGPYRLVGYSFGGLVAYEMARQLTLRGEQVEFLAILDTVNRLHYRRLPTRQQGRMIAQYTIDRSGRHLTRLRTSGPRAFFQEASGALGRRLRPKLLRIKRLVAGRPQPSSVTAIAPSSSVDPLPTNENLAIFTRLAARYEPKPYAGNVLVFHADQRGLEYRSNPTLGWEELAAFGAEAVFVPGDHMTFMRQPNVATLAAELSAHLARAPASPRLRAPEIAR